MVLALMGAAHAAAPLAVLKQSSPALYKLYQTYPSYHQTFVDYANRQGFRRPVENLATVVHEIIHIDSHVHLGYFIEGVYYEPYLTRSAWPSLTNKDVQPYMTGAEQGVIYRYYVLNSPDNHLGNVVDEINAYGHVLQFVCRNEPESADKQIANLAGHLQLQEAYLRTLRLRLPAEHTRLARTRESRGAISLISQRAWAALKGCGVAEAAIPGQELIYFLNIR